MAATQPFGFACKGGLDTNLSQLELLEFAGKATTLLNYEVDPDGGYRRINGFQPYGDGTKPNGTNSIKGVFPYADGVIVCSGTDIYFSNTGNSWVQINRTGVPSSGDNYTNFTANNILSRPSQGQSEFVFIDDGGYGKVVILDGANPPYLFYMTGTGGLATRTFFADELAVGNHVGPSNADNPTTACYHKTMLIVAGISDAPNIVAYTSFNKTSGSDITSSSNSNALAVDDEIVALRSFRDDVIVFCKNSLHKIVNVETSDIAVVPITKNVGCVSRASIQELGGDLLFLAPDGIRTLAGTARIGDVELSSVSRQIQSNIKEMTSNISNFTISSVVVREKSQYRLFYSNSTESPDIAKGFIGTFTPRGFEWSEVKGIQALGIGANFDEDNESVIYHGDKDGYIYKHNTGNSFYASGSASDIEAKYVSPFLDFGDSGTLKTLMYIKSSFSLEGVTQPTLQVIYDFNDLSVAQPQPYVLQQLPLPSVFGTAIFNTGEFGGLADPLVRQAVEGSGHTISLTLSSDDSNPPYAINGFYIDYYPSGRR
jgi:hypothetical protein